MIIREYNEKDKKAVQEVCLYCDGYEELSEDSKNFILSTYCDYFIEQEPHNCFVAADEEDRAIGYILCAQNFDEFIGCFRSEYITRIPEEDRQHRRFAVLSVTLQEKYNKEYPAHLHIDILGDYQRMGIGHKLMDALLEHLRNKGIKGVMLTLSTENTKGMAFYKKYGFELLEELPDTAAFGIKL